MDTSLRVRRRHRSWPEALKREIVAASMAPGASVSLVARQYDVNTNLLFTWRKRLGETAPAAPAPQMVPVVAVPDPPVATPPTNSAEVIEIELPRGYRIRVGSNVKGAALRLVLDALERR
jgi:transposase